MATTIGSTYKGNLRKNILMTAEGTKYSLSTFKETQEDTGWTTYIFPWDEEKNAVNYSPIYIKPKMTEEEAKNHHKYVMDNFEAVVGTL